MKNNRKFGAEIRKLRKRAGLSLRQLAARVDVDASYPSQIENGVLPPPGEKVSRQLAEILKADQDDLITPAGRIPLMSLKY
jgi:transcriptional regulator with XRE-family HTH domain